MIFGNRLKVIQEKSNSDIAKETEKYYGLYLSHLIKYKIQKK